MKYLHDIFLALSVMFIFGSLAYMAVTLGYEKGVEDGTAKAKAYYNKVICK